MTEKQSKTQEKIVQRWLCSLSQLTSALTDVYCTGESLELNKPSHLIEKGGTKFIPARNTSVFPEWVSVVLYSDDITTQSCTYGRCQISL